MFNSVVLDVAIGLTFLYALLSVLCTGLGELIESWLKVRASNLERGIRTLLQDPTGQGLAKQLYEHPLIDGLFRGKYDPSQIQKGSYASGSLLPSYIPASKFAAALLEIVMGDDYNRSASAPARSDAAAFARLQAAIAAQPSEPLMRALSALIVDARGDMARVQANLETWFDSAMDRASGWYRRRAQWISLGLGLALALLLNADSLALARSLSLQPALRDSLVAQAQEYAKRPAPPRASPNPAAAIPECQRDENSSECGIERSITRIQALGLPIGWSEAALPRTPLTWLSKLLGVLLTALAISLGAPFWFDVLNRLSVIRATVKPREKSPEEPPVDRAAPAAPA